MKFENDQKNQRKSKAYSIAYKAWNDATDLEREIGYYPDADMKAVIGELKQMANQISQLLGMAGPVFRGVPWYDHPQIVREWLEDNGLS